MLWASKGVAGQHAVPAHGGCEALPCAIALLRLGRAGPIPPDGRSMTNPLIRRLERSGSLSDEEKRVLESAISRVKTFGPDEDIVRQGDRSTESSLILEGFACRQKILADGQRQITALHIPGDFADLHRFLLKKLDDGVVTLTPCKVALVPHETLRRIVKGYPHLTQLLWFTTLVDAAIQREWMTAMGRRSSLGQVAHLLCELTLRLRAVGLVTDDGYQLPVTQTELGDALGLSLVHINRTLQELRGEGLISWKGKVVEIVDWEGLQQLAEFDPTYLHLDHEGL
jgi:CRP-like cAMP-binding protein